MGGAVYLGLVFVILVIFIGNGNEVRASPVPDICSYFRPHRRHRHSEETTTAEPSDDEGKGDKKEKVEQFQKLLGEFLLWDETTTTTKKPKKQKKPKSEPKSISSMEDSIYRYLLDWLLN